MTGMEGPPPVTLTTAPKLRYAPSGGIHTKSGIYLRICVLKRYKAFAQQMASVAPNRPDWLLALPSPLSNGYWGSFTTVKQPGREADHSAPSCAGVKNEWSYTSYISWRGQQLDLSSNVFAAVLIHTVAFWV
jgi:hypothetical protein